MLLVVLTSSVGFGENCRVLAWICDRIGANPTGSDSHLTIVAKVVTVIVAIIRIVIMRRK